MHLCRNNNTWAQLAVLPDHMQPTGGAHLCILGGSDVGRIRAVEGAVWPVGRAGTSTSPGRVRGKMANFDQRA
eukprot:8950283-Alexandrium_andersonii.AAC.1